MWDLRAQPGGAQSSEAVRGGTKAQGIATLELAFLLSALQKVPESPECYCLCPALFFRSCDVPPCGDALTL